MNLNEKNLSIVSPVSLFPEKHGGSLRICNLAKVASKFFNYVTVYAISEIAEDNLNKQFGNLKFIQINIPEEKIKLEITERLNKLIFGQYWRITKFSGFPIEAYDLVQIEFPFFYNLVKKKKKRYILDQHNVTWDQHSQFNNTASYPRIRQWINTVDKKTEKLAIKDAEHILITSAIDKAKIIQEIPEAEFKITIIPNCINIREYIPTNFRQNKDKKIVLFIGTLTYFPNVDAVNLICDEIAPRFDNNIKFLIVGKGYKKITCTDNMIFAGYVDDIKSIISSSDVCIAPLRYGSGTRLKILEYMALEKPVVSTTKGAEGLEYKNGRDIIIEDDMKLFSERIGELLDNELKSKYIGKCGRKLVENKYSWDQYIDVLGRIYNKII